MLSYRHAFHAGNHADVLKHMVIIQLMRYLGQKDPAYMVIDTHAGAGVYALDGDFASKNAEYETGIAKLWDRKDLPAMVKEYVDLVRSLNPSGKMRYYPGSPYCAEKTMREQDRLRLFEMHPSEVKVLEDNFRKLEAHAAAQGQRPAARGKRVMVYRGDGFQGLKALLPPPSRRGLVLIDPPYEDKRDYTHVAQCWPMRSRASRPARMQCGTRSCIATNRASCLNDSSAWAPRAGSTSRWPSMVRHRMVLVCTTAACSSSIRPGRLRPS